ncbi:MAG: hypothetical protein DRH57_07475, partial [Candidatus Cloacimonadota bacterium]
KENMNSKNIIPDFIIKKLQDKEYYGQITGAVLFADVTGFTKLTESLLAYKKEGVEILSEMLNKIFSPLIKQIYHNNGFVATFAGDAFTAIFIDRYNNISESCFWALSSAKKIQEFVLENRIQDTKFGRFEFAIDIGLSYGTINWGILRSNGKMNFYFKGKPITNAVKCENNAFANQILFDDNLYQHIKDNQDIISSENKPLFYLKDIAYQSLSQKSIIKQNFCEEPLTIDDETLFKFFPPTVVNFNRIGEFRNVVSVFISFNKANNYNEINYFFSKVRSILSSYGGYFNKIDFGDKESIILVLFGAPKSFENDIQRSVDFVYELNQSFINYELATKLHKKTQKEPEIRSQQEEYPIRFGITSGTAYAGIIGGDKRWEYTAIGDIVNISALMAISADWGQILCDENTKKNIESYYYCNALEPREFKGKKEKISIFSIEYKKEYKHKIFYTGKFINRENELEKLYQKAMILKEHKNAGIVYIHSQPGMGKTRLLYEFRQLLYRKRIDFFWLTAPCEKIIRRSLNPFEYALNNYFSQSVHSSEKINKKNFDKKFQWLVNNLIKLEKVSKDSHKIQLYQDLREELIRTYSILGSVVKLYWKGSLYEQLDAKGRFNSTLFALKNFIKILSLFHPIIIALEDAQFLDDGTKQFLQIFSRNIAEFPVLILANFRYRDDGSTISYDHFDDSFPKDEIHLKKFNPTQIKDIAHQTIGKEKIDTEVLELFYEKTQGNPFYIEQLGTHLRENEIIRKEDNKWRIAKKDFEIPQSINSILIARIDRLSENLKNVLFTASVLGQEFKISILLGMMNDNNIHSYIEEGINKSLWSQFTDVIYFRHALLRDIAYQMQLKSRVREIHKRAADIMEGIYGDNIESYADNLAYHYEKAEVTDKAIYYLEIAGKLAKREYRNKEALNLYDRLLALLDDKKKITRILLEKGEVQTLIGDWSGSEQTFQRAIIQAEEISAHSLVAEGKRKLAGILMNRGDYSSSINYLKEAVDLFNLNNDKKGISSAVGNLGVLYWKLRKYDIAMKYYKKDLSICIELNDKSRLAKVHNNIGLLYMSQDNFDKAMIHYKKALSLNRKLDNKIEISKVIGNIGLIYQRLRQFPQAMKQHQKKLALCKELSDKSGTSTALSNIGLIYYYQKKYHKAIDYLKQSIHIKLELGDVPRIIENYYYLAEVYKRLNQFRTAEKYYEKMLSLSRDIHYD